MTSLRHTSSDLGMLKRIRLPWKLATLLVAVLLAGLTAEIFARGSKRFRVYSERTIGSYAVGWDREWEKWTYTRAANTSRMFDRTGEFEFPLSTNREGVRDVDHPVRNLGGELRILTFGDSFTEGVGAAWEDSWPQQLRLMLQADPGLPVDMLQAGVSGSDPVFEVVLLEERFLKYEPDLVIVSINRSDIMDLVYRGGFERYRDDGTVRGRPAPFFHPLYRASHLFRAFLHGPLGYQSSLLSMAEHKRQRRAAMDVLQEALERFSRLASENDFELVVVFHPTAAECAGQFREYLPETVQSVREAGIRVLDLYGPMCRMIDRGNETEYAWPIDHHFKAKGYLLLAEKLSQGLIARGWWPPPARHAAEPATNGAPQPAAR